MTSFVLHNTSETNMIIVHEPECFEFILKPGEEVSIITECCENSVELRYSINGENIVVAILDDRSRYMVIQNGVDVFGEFM